MKQITGIKKYLYLLPGMFTTGALRLPLRFTAGLFRMMHSEKLTVLDGRIYVNTHFTPLPSRSFSTAVSSMLSISRGRPKPESVYISLTDDCVFNCSYCSNHKNIKSGGLSAERIMSVIRQVQDAGACCIGFTGGEPLLRKDLEEIVASVGSRSYTVLFTSGYGLSRERALRLKKAGLDVACVSLDCHDRERFNSDRGSGAAFDCAVNAVKLFASAGIYTSVSAVLPGDGVVEDEILDFVLFSGGIGAHEVRFLEPVSSGKIAHAAPAINPSGRAVMERLRRKVNRDPLLPKIVLLSRMESPECFGCGAGWFHMYVDAAGNLCPCDFVQTAYGSLNDESFETLYAKMRADIRPFTCTCLVERQRGSVTDESMPGLMGKLVKGGKMYG